MERSYLYNRGTIPGISKAEQLVSDLEKNIYEGTDQGVFILVKQIKNMHRIDVDIYEPKDFHIVNLILNNHNMDDDKKLSLYYGIDNQRFLMLRSGKSNKYTRLRCVSVEDTTYRDAVFLKENTISITLHY